MNAAAFRARAGHAAKGTVKSSSSRNHIKFSPAAGRTGQFGLLLVAALVAGFNLFGSSQDVANYAIVFEWASEAEWDELLGGNDPGYLVVSRLASELGLTFPMFAFTVVMTACSCKFAVLSRLETRHAVLLALYFSYLFWLHEYTQLRVAVSLGLVMLAIYRPTRAAWILFLCAALFHASTAALIIIYFLLQRPRILLILLAITVPVLAFSTLADTLIQQLALRVAHYIYQRDAGVNDKINMFSLMPITQGAILLAVIPHLRSLPPTARLEAVFSFTGLLAFYGLSFIPILAFRIYELFIPFFLILTSRVWERSQAIQILSLIYGLLGLRLSFLGSESLAFWPGG